MFPWPAKPTTRYPHRWPTYWHRTTGQQHYTRAQTVPLLQTGQSLVSGGTATVQMGPSGVGTKWYPMTMSFSTSSGPGDGSQAVMYFGYVSQSTLVDARAYAGGGDAAGLAIPMMTPGDLIVIHWTAATNGDIAQATITGTMDMLVTA